jgi:hypothetical protein
VAQLGARLDGIEEVVGSNPIGSTKFILVFYLYILQCGTTGRFYIGQAQDVPERLAYHNANIPNHREIRTSTVNSQQDLFVSFQGNAVSLGSFQSALPGQGSNPYTYSHGVGLK